MEYVKPTRKAPDQKGKREPCYPSKQSTMVHFIDLAAYIAFAEYILKNEKFKFKNPIICKSTSNSAIKM